MEFLQSKCETEISNIVISKRDLLEYALAIIGSFIAVYIFSPISKDGDAYLNIYENIFDQVEIEYLFRSWLEFGSVLEVSFSTILLPLIFFTLLLKLKALKQFGAYSVYGYLAYGAIFYLLHDCSQLRISAALAFALWSCVAIMQRKWIYALLLCLFAAGFHITSLLLPIVFAACFYSRAICKFSWYFFLLGILIYFLKIPIMAIAAQKVALLLGGRYIYYTEVFINEQNTSGLAFVYAALLGILLVVVYYWGKTHSKMLPKSFPAMLSTCIYGCGLMFWFYETVALASRLSDVLVILIVPLLAIVIANINFIYRSLSIILLGIFFTARIFQLFIY